MVATTELDGVYSALADPTRRAIIVQLTHGEATVSELAGPHPTSFQSISQHVKILEKAGLVSRGRIGRTRPCRLEADALEVAVSWIDEARAMWSGRLDRLDAHLATMARAQRGRAGD
jgi:DNA-binding transcriptional ArsR family regulator